MLLRLSLAAFALTGVPLVAAWLVASGVLHPKPRVEDHGLIGVLSPGLAAWLPNLVFLGVGLLLMMTTRS